MESNHIKESYAEAIQNINIWFKDLVSHKDKELTDFEVVSKIKQ